MPRKKKTEVLARIPLVMDIRERADGGRPVAVDLEDDPGTANPEARAFAELADNVVAAVERRNAELPPSVKVEMKP